MQQLQHAKIALITSGGIVPVGNPDRIESSAASKFRKYDISNLHQLAPEDYEAVHGGYDPTVANANPNRILPLDVIRDLEREGIIGNVYPYYFATVGNGTTVSNAKKFGLEIAEELLSEGVQAVIISST